MEGPSKSAFLGTYVVKVKNGFLAALRGANQGSGMSRILPGASLISLISFPGLLHGRLSIIRSLCEVQIYFLVEDLFKMDI